MLFLVREIANNLNLTVPPVLDGIVRKNSQYIKFPSHTVKEQADIKRQFAAKSCFQNVIVVIDCTHVVIQSEQEPSSKDLQLVLLCECFRVSTVHPYQSDVHSLPTGQQLSLPLHVVIQCPPRQSSQ